MGKKQTQWLLIDKNDITKICHKKTTDYFISIFGSKQKFLYFLDSGKVFQDKYFIIEDC